MDRNAHATDLLKEIAPNGATPEQRQHVKDMLKFGVSDGDIRNLYAQGLGVGQGTALACNSVQSKFELNQSFTTDDGNTYSTDAPDKVTDLRNRYPLIVKKEQGIWDKSDVGYRFTGHLTCHG
jgi:hypothetical protein